VKYWLRSRSYAQDIEIVQPEKTLTLPVNIQHEYVYTNNSARHDRITEEPTAIEKNVDTKALRAKLHRKLDTVLRSVRKIQSGTALLLVNEQEKMTDVLAYLAKRNPQRVVALTDLMASGARRDEIHEMVREQDFDLIVGTARACRGLDIPTLECVFVVDHDILGDHHAYLHAAGRTSRRVFSNGRCITVLDDAREHHRLVNNMEKKLGLHLTDLTSSVW
jgi:superfamily II DNA/RNA helicase